MLELFTDTLDRIRLRDTQCWLFDMDGTLTRAVHDFDAIRAALELPPGKPILESIDALPPAEARERHQALDEIEMQIAECATAQPGAHALLQQLHDEGRALGIVTRNGHAIAEATLNAAGLARFFTPESIVGRHCASPKPAPDGIALLLSRLDTPASDALMAGDYLFDLQAGRSAGTSTVHFDVEARYPWPDVTDVGVPSLQTLRDLWTS